jgi:hypothetical protein
MLELHRLALRLGRGECGVFVWVVDLPDGFTPYGVGYAPGEPAVIGGVFRPVAFERADDALSAGLQDARRWLAERGCEAAELAPVVADTDSVAWDEKDYPDQSEADHPPVFNDRAEMTVWGERVCHIYARAAVLRSQELVNRLLHRWLFSDPCGHLRDILFDCSTSLRMRDGFLRGGKYFLEADEAEPPFTARCSGCGDDIEWRPDQYRVDGRCGRCGPLAVAFRCAGCAGLVPVGTDCVWACPPCEALLAADDVTGPQVWRMRTGRRVDQVLGALATAMALAQPSAGAPWFAFFRRVVESHPLVLPAPAVTRGDLAAEGLQGRQNAFALGLASVYRAPSEVVGHVDGATESLARDERLRRRFAALLGAGVPFLAGNSHGPAPAEIAGVAVEQLTRFGTGLDAFRERWIAGEPEPEGSPLFAERTALDAVRTFDDDEAGPSRPPDDPWAAWLFHALLGASRHTCATAQALGEQAGALFEQVGVVRPWLEFALGFGPHASGHEDPDALRAEVRAVLTDLVRGDPSPALELQWVAERFQLEFPELQGRLEQLYANRPHYSWLTYVMRYVRQVVKNDGSHVWSRVDGLWHRVAGAGGGS